MPDSSPLDKPRVVAIIGPTAAGKTAVAVDLAEALNGEIVGADSVQVYRGMDIGSGKASAEARARVRHHLIDVVDPDTPFDARTYARLAAVAIEDIHNRGRRPFVVGGTGLYLKALLEGMMDAPPGDPALRERLDSEHPGPALHARLSEVDPVAATRIHPADRVRTLRALEVQEVTGKPISEHQAAHAFTDRPFATLWLGLRVPRDALAKHIDDRVRSMFAGGFEEEVRSLLADGYTPKLRPMGALGYKHVCALVDGAISREEAMRLTQRDTRRFAKRQMTWFRKVEDVRWSEPPWDLEAWTRSITGFFSAEQP